MERDPPASEGALPTVTDGDELWKHAGRRLVLEGRLYVSKNADGEVGLKLTGGGSVTLDARLRPERDGQLVRIEGLLVFESYMYHPPPPRGRGQIGVRELADPETGELATKPFLVRTFYVTDIVLLEEDGGRPRRTEWPSRSQSAVEM